MKEKSMSVSFHHDWASYEVIVMPSFLACVARFFILGNEKNVYMLSWT